MTPDRWQAIERLYYAALDARDAAARVALLDRACAGDADLRDEVESLLAQQPPASAFMAEPALVVAAAAIAADPASLTGVQLGPYAIFELIGVGGMGEVYRGRDTRLGRDVAIKVLPAYLSRDPERRLRFEREARAISALNHPNICAIYDVGRERDVDFLVLEYVDGETLTDRLAKGPIPLQRGIDYALQVAHGLAAAHDKGIVHRDLKPGNVIVDADDRVKILDFGLAKLAAPEPADDGPTAGFGTESGVVMGTAGYMSPEQVRGQPSDWRSDIFAFGAVLYEMLTGTRAFQRDSAVESMNAILATDPAPPSALGCALPPALERVILRCLEKRPERRFQSTSDLAFALGALSTPPTEVGSVLPNVNAAARARRTRIRLWAAGGFALAVSALAVIASIALRRADAPAGGDYRFYVMPPAGTIFPSSERIFAMSPNGRTLAFVATTHDGRTLLWTRPLDSFTARAIDGTDDAIAPFWSPDSRVLGFFANDKLKLVAMEGGAPTDICAAPDPGGGAWSRDGTILFASHTPHRLFRVSAAGGTPVPVDSIQGLPATALADLPQFLPDGRHFLFNVGDMIADGLGLYAGSLDSPLRVRIMADDARYEYTAAGQLMYVGADGVLKARPFDGQRLRLSGDAVTVAEQVFLGFSVADTGALAYGTGRRTSALTWVDRSGAQLGTVATPDNNRDPAISPDGTSVIFDRFDVGTNSVDLWFIDVARLITSKFSVGLGYAAMPAWSPDGTHIAFSGKGPQGGGIFVRSASGSANSERLAPGGGVGKQVTQWSPDGRYIVYTSLGANRDVWLLPVAGDRRAVPVIQTAADEGQAQLSPDMRWIAYVSNESGRPEVYVQSFPASDMKAQISIDGGIEPRWRADGGELFYVARDRRLMAVRVDGRSAFNAGRPQPLFEVRPGSEFNMLRNAYDVTADGQRFLVLTLIQDPNALRIAVLSHWQGAR